MSSTEPVRICRVLPHESTSAVDLIIAARHAAVPAIPPLVHTDGEVRVWFETVVMPTQDVWVAESEAGGSLDLWTFESNVGAQRFYERAGFVVVDRTDGDNEEQAPDRRYRWDEP